MVLQQPRVALEKMDLPLNGGPVKLFKRRHSDDVATFAKKRRQGDIANTASRSKSTDDSATTNTNKITNYMSETKHFTALRKEKLDQVLNLKSEVLENKTDLFLLSQLEQLKQLEKLQEVKVQSEVVSPVKEEEEKASEDNPVIRFPLEKSSSTELTLCKWENCGIEVESTGKLLDHLKVYQNYFKLIKGHLKVKCRS